MSSKRQVKGIVILKEFTIFIFIASALMFLVLFTIKINSGEKSDIVKFVDFNDVGSLEKGDRVYLNGMEMGVVKEINVSPDNPQKIRVKFFLTNDLEFYEDHEVRVQTLSAMGFSSLAISQGDHTKKVYPGDVLRGTDSIDLFEKVAGIKSGAKEIQEHFNLIQSKFANENNSLNKITDKENGILNQVAKSKEKLDANSDKIDNLKKSFEELKDDFEKELDFFESVQDDLSASRKSIDETGETVKALLEKFKEGNNDISKLMTDKSLQNNFNDIKGNFESFAKSYENKDSSLYKMMNDEALIDKFKSAQNIYNTTSETFSEIEDKIKNGNGTLALWLKDREIANDIKRTIGEMRDSIFQFQLYTPVQTLDSFVFDAL